MASLGRMALGDITGRNSGFPSPGEKFNLRSYRSESRIQRQVRPLDTTAKVLDYVEEINNFMRATESAKKVPHNHLSHCQNEVTDKMRAILVDWLVDVHLKYKCRPETLYLAVNLLDRYLLVRPVEKRKLQLVGCVAMMLACKYEDINPPEVRDFVHISANTYTRGEMLNMERSMLVTLDYNLTVPTLWNFLTQYLQGERNEVVRHGAEYLAEQTLMCGTLVGFKPSLQAAACIYLARQALDVANPWSAELQRVTMYCIEDLQEIMDLLQEHIRRVPNLKIVAVRKKYSHSRYNTVSRRFDAYAEY